MQGVTSRNVTFDEDKIVRYITPQSQSANTHPFLIPAVINNVTTPPPGPIPAIHLRHPHVTVPPITAPPPVTLSPPQFSPNHNLNFISAVSIPSLPSQDTGQQTCQGLPTTHSCSNDDPYDFSTLTHPIHYASHYQSIIPVSIQDVVPVSPAPVSTVSSSSRLLRRGVDPPILYGD